jgi:PAS domain S-box-containing protein
LKPLFATGKKSGRPALRPFAKTTATTRQPPVIFVTNGSADSEADHAARRLAAIVESSDDAIASKNLNGIVQSWNTGAEKIFGYRPEEIIGKSITILIPPERRAEERMIVDKIRRGQRVQHYETVRVRKDGSLIDVSLTISPIRDSSGKVIAASKIARDITERKRSEGIQRALYDFITTVNRTTDFQSVCNAAIDAILKCQHANRAAIVAFNGMAMRFVAWRGLSTAYRLLVEGYSPWKSNNSMPCSVMIADVPVGLEEPVRTAAQRESIRALAFVPITFEKQLLGHLGIFYNMPHPFTREEMRPTETIAAQLAFVMERRNAGTRTVM